MRAKCPDCQSGCSKCTNGYIEVQLAENGKWWTRVCTNEKECGFVNGGYHTVNDQIPEEPSEGCVNCGAETNWIDMDLVDSEENWKKPENRIKHMTQHHEESTRYLRKMISDLRNLSLQILDGKKDFTLDECRLMDICRVCKKPIGNSNVTLNYGEEFAHTPCLK